MAERLRLSDAALRGLFRKTAQAVASAPIRNALAIHDGDATDQSVDYRFIKMPPGLREWIDGRQMKGLEAATITVPLKKYDSSIDIKSEDLYFDRINQIQSTIGNWRNRVDETGSNSSSPRSSSARAKPATRASTSSTTTTSTATAARSRTC